MTEEALNGQFVGKRFDDSKIVKGRQPSGKVASFEWLHSTVQNYIGGYLTDNAAVRFADEQYYLPTKEELNYLLQESRLERMAWTQERFDCDDFAYALKGEMSVHAYKTESVTMGFAVGIAWGEFSWVEGLHAINWAMDSEGQFYFIEPQSDGLYPHNDCTSVDLLLL